MKKTRNEVTVGFFVVIGFILLALVVFFISGVYVFRNGYALNVMYDYVDILDKGAPVRMAGVRIGEVSQVSLFYEPKTQSTRVKVKLFIEEKTKIRQNYSFEIRGTHILSEPHIEVTPVPGEAPALRNGDVIEGQKLYPIEDLIKSSRRIAEGLTESSDSLNGILKHVQSGEGTVGNLMMKDDLYQDMKSFTSDIKAHPWKLLKKDSGKRRFLFF